MLESLDSTMYLDSSDTEAIHTIQVVIHTIQVAIEGPKHTQSDLYRCLLIRYQISMWILHSCDSKYNG